MHICITLAVIPHDYCWLVPITIHALKQVKQLPLQPTWAQLPYNIENAAVSQRLHRLLLMTVTLDSAPNGRNDFSDPSPLSSQESLDEPGVPTDYLLADPRFQSESGNVITARVLLDVRCKNRTSLLRYPKPRPRCTLPSHSQRRQRHLPRCFIQGS